MLSCGFMPSQSTAKLPASAAQFLPFSIAICYCVCFIICFSALDFCASPLLHHHLPINLCFEKNTGGIGGIRRFWFNCSHSVACVLLTATQYEVCSAKACGSNLIKNFYTLLNIQLQHGSCNIGFVASLRGAGFPPSVLSFVIGGIDLLF
jgi:hypothetical protein